MDTERRRRIVITGASRGIGEATALELAGADAELVLVARSKDALEDVRRRCEERGARAWVLTTDLSCAESATTLADAILERVGPPDVLILNAGVANDAAFLDAPVGSATREVGVNYLAPVALMKRLLPFMYDRRSSIVVVSSLTVHVPFPGNGTYSASKAALHNLLRTLRIELRDSQVHVGAVMPGYTDTAMAEAVSPPFGAMQPSRVARAVRRCIDERRTVVVPGVLNWLAARLFRNAPEVADRLMTVGLSAALRLWPPGRAP